MPILRAVIDTSVLISVAFAKEGAARTLRDLIADDTFVLVVSKATLKELYEVLHYPRIVERFNPSQNDTKEFISMIIEHASITKGTYRIDGITEDPKDDMFIACALEGKADYIVSRDPHLRNIKHFHGIQIVDLTAFINKVQRKR